VNGALPRQNASRLDEGRTDRVEEPAEAKASSD
jgi:hypothetical protein